MTKTILALILITSACVRAQRDTGEPRQCVGASELERQRYRAWGIGEGLVFKDCIVHCSRGIAECTFSDGLQPCLLVTAACNGGYTCKKIGWDPSACVEEPEPEARVILAGIGGTGRPGGPPWCTLADYIGEPIRFTLITSTFPHPDRRLASARCTHMVIGQFASQPSR